MLKLVKNYSQKLALESMAPMKLKLDFFNDLVKNIDEARDKIRKMKKEGKKYKMDVFEEIGFRKQFTGLVSKHTGININKMTVGHPSVQLPQLGDHIFMRNILDRYKNQWEEQFSNKNHAIDLMTRLKKNNLSASVDVVNGEVKGDFKLVDVEMRFDPVMFEEKSFSSEELAAIFLHEIGHVYTGFLYLNRSILSNQVLAAMARTYEGSFSEQDRQYVIEHFCNENKVSAEQKVAMKKCKNPEELTVIYMSAEVDDCKSELGYSLYDTVSCEQLADEYATRCGAGKYLAGALNRLFVHYGQTDNGIFFRRILKFVFRVVWFVALSALLSSAIGVVAAANVILILQSLSMFGNIFGPDKRDELYDNSYARLNRIRQTSIDKLKDESISEEDKKTYLEDIETVDSFIDNYSDGLRFEEISAYILRPAFRRAHKFEMLQKELETLASNKLFVSAAKLKMI